MGQTFKRSLIAIAAAHVDWKMLAVAYHRFINTWLRGPSGSPLFHMISSWPVHMLSTAYLFATIADLDLHQIRLEFTIRVYF